MDGPEEMDLGLAPPLTLLDSKLGSPLDAAVWPIFIISS